MKRILTIIMVIGLFLSFSSEASAHWRGGFYRGWRPGFVRPYVPVVPVPGPYYRPYYAPSVAAPVFRDVWVAPHYRRTPYGDQYVPGHYRRVRVY